MHPVRRSTWKPLPSIARWLATAATGLLLVLSSGRAVAQTGDLITFDFTGASSISLLGGTVVTPPDGTLDVGEVKIFVEGTAPGVFVPGGLFVFQDLSLSGTVAKTIPGAAVVSGTYEAEQLADLVGTTSAGLSGGDFVDDLQLDLNFDVGCTGGGCGILGLPLSEVGTSLLSIGFLPVSGLDSPNSAAINLSMPIEVAGVLGQIDLVGVEVARSFVPEPSTFAMVLLGLGALGAQSRRR